MTLDPNHTQVALSRQMSTNWLKQHCLFWARGGWRGSPQRLRGSGAPEPGVGAGGWNTVGEAEIIRSHISLTPGTSGTGHKEHPTYKQIYSIHISPFLKTVDDWWTSGSGFLIIMSFCKTHISMLALCFYFRFSSCSQRGPLESVWTGRYLGSFTAFTASLEDRSIRGNTWWIKIIDQSFPIKFNAKTILLYYLIGEGPASVHFFLYVYHYYWCVVDCETISPGAWDNYMNSRLSSFL